MEQTIYDTDTFLPIPFAEKYGVSPDGRIINFRSGNITRGYRTGRGYLALNFQRNYKSIPIKAHRAVALVYVPNPHNYKEVNHIDGNKENNHFTNLEWCSRSRNVKHAFDIGLRKGSMFGKSGKSHNKSKPVLQLTIDGIFLKEWDSATQAEKEGGFNDGNIAQCCKGRIMQHMGFKWAYKS